MILLDSGYLIALAKPRDSLHERAKAWAARVQESVVVTEFVLCETLNSLSLPTDRPKGHRTVEMLRSNPRCRIVPATADLFEIGLRLHMSRPDKMWSLTDCVSFTVMDHLAIHRALAHDEHFEQAGYEALLRHDP